MRYEKNARKSARAEIERQKLKEMAKARVRQVDDKGRAYGTGRRKCSVARVWVQPGDGKFAINDKDFDVYFPMLDHRAALLQPFSETKTLGLWDINCTVKGGGVSGQVGAIWLGISRALQNFEPELRRPLRAGQVGAIWLGISRALQNFEPELRRPLRAGQVGAIWLGISRALQNFEPELRRPLRAAGFLTRDPRVVERKKPGTAKARKSFQWVKR